jgi:hypothetical protein
VVHLDREDPGARLGERDRQRPETGADLEDPIALPNAGIGHDRAGEVRVGEEVLAPDPGRPDPVARREVLQLGAAEAVPALTS